MNSNPLLETVVTIDCHYVAEKRMSAYLIIEGDRATFVDNNTQFAVPHMLNALKENGLTPEQVDYAIITHVHLDHAGGSAALMAACPNATLLAHPKAARHVIAPERLIMGAKVIYGESQFANLYGDIDGVDEGRVQIMDDGDVVTWGDRKLRFFYNLGHASHHMCIHDTKSNTVFTGDSFGVGRTWPEGDQPPFHIASTSPPEFNSEEAKKDVQTILDTGATQVAPAHFGIIEDLPTATAQLLRSIDDMESITLEALATELPDEDLEIFCRKRVVEVFHEHLTWCGVTDREKDIQWLKNDIALNAKGTAFNAMRRRKNRN